MTPMKATGMELAVQNIVQRTQTNKRGRNGHIEKFSVERSKSVLFFYVLLGTRARRQSINRKVQR